MSQWSMPAAIAPYVSRPVIAYPAMIRIAGGLEEGVFLGQAIFWSTLPKARQREGWWAHDAGCIEAQLGLSGKSQKRIRRHLVRLGLLDERRTTGNRVTCRARLTDIEAALEDDARHGAAAPEEDGGCGCAEAGEQVRAAEVAYRQEQSLQTPESSQNRQNGDSRIAEAEKPESPNRQNSRSPVTTSVNTSHHSRRQRRRGDDDDGELIAVIERTARLIAAGKGPERGCEIGYIASSLGRRIRHADEASVLERLDAAVKRERQTSERQAHEASAIAERRRRAVEKKARARLAARIGS